VVWSSRLVPVMWLPEGANASCQPVSNAADLILQVVVVHYKVPQVPRGTSRWGASSRRVDAMITRH